MEVIDLEIPEVKLVKPKRFPDSRGFFQQTYHAEQYAAAGITASFVQDNWSHSSKGTLRGLHYQLEHAQAKLVSVLQGEVFDVVVDVRRSSPTFGHWIGVVLSAENACQLFVPKGFAHGFVVLSESADFMYKCDDVYTQGDEYGIIWNDPDIAIDWPASCELTISEKDNILPSLSSAVVFD